MPLVAVGDVVLWDALTLLAEADEYGSEYVTDVFRRGSTPPPLAIAVAVGEPVGGILVDAAYGPWIVGLAAVYNTRGVAQGKVGSRFEPWTSIQPIPVNEALARSLGGDAKRVELPHPMTVTKLSGSQGNRLLRFLEEHDPEVGHWLAGVRHHARAEVDIQRQSRRETRDAVGLAGILANVDVPGSAIRRPVVSDAESLLESVLSSAHRADLDEELIPEALRRVGGCTEPQR